MAEIFHDDGTTIWQFENEFLVRCPRCGSKAFVHGDREGNQPRFVCEQCALTRGGDSPPGYITSDAAASGPIDRYFGLSLWLQTPCLGHTLWAYNLSHLQFLERVVSADLRLRHRPVSLPYVNSRLASRLPQWMLSAKHREAVVRGLAELRALALG